MADLRSLTARGDVLEYLVFGHPEMCEKANFSILKELGVSRGEFLDLLFVLKQGPHAVNALRRKLITVYDIARTSNICGGFREVDEILSKFPTKEEPLFPEDDFNEEYDWITLNPVFEKMEKFQVQDGYKVVYRSTEEAVRATGRTFWNLRRRKKNGINFS